MYILKEQIYYKQQSLTAQDILTRFRSISTESKSMYLYFIFYLFYLFIYIDTNNSGLKVPGHY